MVPKHLSKKTRIAIGVGVVLPLLLVGIPAVVSYRAEKEVKRSFHWVTHTLEVQRAIQGLTASLVDAETGQRGYLLTRREAYLEPYDASRARILSEVHDLRTLTDDNASQQARLKELNPLIQERLALLAYTIVDECNGSHDAALEKSNTGRGKFVMDKIRGVLRVMNDEEERLLWMRQQTLGQLASRSTLMLWSLVLVSAVFAGALVLLLTRISRLQNGAVTRIIWPEREPGIR